jgi:hypothetical protein
VTRPDTGQAESGRGGGTSTPQTILQQAYPDPDLLRQWASRLNPFRRKLL